MEQIYTQDGCLYAAQTVMYVHQVDLINLCVLRSYRGFVRKQWFQQ